MNHYEYPNELYCIGCDLDVKTKIETVTETAIHESGKKISYEYKVAVCPNCGNVLCSRDKEFAFVNAIEHFKEGGVSNG
ncbi:MAG: hypothetical protein IKH75_01360 [Ruminococcus sp.]|nr:hypothetical protein [Ruminococcus sp.]